MMPKIFFMKERKNITTEDLETIKNQYEKDWNEWPADQGALIMI